MFPRSIALLAPTLLLAACGSGTVNRGLESVHQPVVARQDLVFDAAAAGYGLDPAEQARVAGWLASLRLGYGDRVYVDDPAGGSAREQIGTLAAQYGLLISDQAPLTPGAVQPGTVRVVVSRMTAAVPGCPDYSRTEGGLYGNTYSNFGCAHYSNLAAMVARPEDLVRGQPGAPASDTRSNTKAFTSYISAAPTGASGLKSEGVGK